MAGGMSRCCNGMYSWDNFCLVVEQVDSVLQGQQMLVGERDHKFEHRIPMRPLQRHSPELPVGAPHHEARVREDLVPQRVNGPTNVIRMPMGEDNSINSQRGYFYGPQI